MSDRTPHATGGRLLALGAALAAVAIQLPIFDRWFGLLDEGYMLSLADDIRRGQMLYRDVYVDAPFPAAFYLLAGWFGLLGTSVWAERLLAVVVFAVFVAASVRLATLAVPTFIAAIFAVLLLCYRIWAFPHWQVYSYSSLAVTLLSLAVLALAGTGSRPRASRLVLAGVLAGGAVLSKQDYGVYVTGALGLYLLLRLAPRPEETSRFRRGIRDGALLALGVVLVTAPVLIAVAASGAWETFFYQTVLSPLTSTGSGTYVQLPPPTPFFHQDKVLRDGIGSYLPAILQTLRWEAIAASPTYRSTAVWDVGLKAAFYAPYLVWWAAAVWWVLGLLRSRRHLEGVGLLVLAYAGGYLLAFSTPRDWIHLMMIYPSTMLLACVLASEVAATLPRIVRIAVAVPVAAGAAALVVYSAGLARELRASFQWPIPGSRGGVYTNATHGPIVEAVLKRLAELPPGVPVPVYPMQPMLGFLAGRPTVGGFHVIWPFQPADRDRRIIEGFDAQHVPLVVYSLSQYAHLGSFRQNAPGLFDYLADHYELTDTFTRERFGPLLVALSRNDGAPDPVLPALAAQLPADGSAAATTWPFARVLAVRTGTAEAPGGASFTVEVPAGAARLEFAYGLDPERWLTLLDGPFEFEVSVDGTPRFQARLDPVHVLADRRWARGAIDVADMAGRRVRLGFAVRGPASLARDAELAGWTRFRWVFS